MEAVRQGWSLQGIEVDADVQEALIAAGLAPSPQLDDIIKTMQEEQK